MGHEVLARKCRPNVFEAVVGQEHAVRILTHALDSQRLHHAWLLTGTRGTGKTTIARILAKSLNCEAGISSHPCGTCRTCVECDSGKFIDLLEIDAASRTKVEDTRELLESIQYAPARGRFRIYLIDEVHMLSGHSFNALLKTLEEPPPHVKFLLATTDPDKLPITVLSRCLQIHLHHIPPEKISAHLAKICTEEGISAEADALASIATAAKGSLRDALSLLDQAIAYCGETLTQRDVHTLTGTLGTAALYSLLECLLAKDGKRLLAECRALTMQGPDFTEVTASLLSLLQAISVLQVLPEQDAPDTLCHFASRFSAEDIQLYYQIVLNGRRDLPYAPSPASGFEMILLRLLAFTPGTASPASPAPAKKSEHPSAAGSPVTTPPATRPASPPGTTRWSDILPSLSLSGMGLALASHCQMTHLSDTRIELLLARKHESLLNKNLHARLEKALSDWAGKPIELRIHLAAHDIDTPARENEAKIQARKQHASEVLLNDQGLQNIIQTFDATLDPDSIQASESS